MKVVDVNVLLYAVNEDADRHAVLRRWWVDALNGGRLPAHPGDRGVGPVRSERMERGVAHDKLYLFRGGLIPFATPQGTARPPRGDCRAEAGRSGGTAPAGMGCIFRARCECLLPVATGHHNRQEAPGRQGRPSRPVYPMSSPRRKRAVHPSPIRRLLAESDRRVGAWAHAAEPTRGTAFLSLGEDARSSRAER